MCLKTERYSVIPGTKVTVFFNRLNKQEKQKGMEKRYERKTRER